jgi:hypothetical protein
VTGKTESAEQGHVELLVKDVGDFLEVTSSEADWKAATTERALVVFSAPNRTGGL